MNDVHANNDISPFPERILKTLKAPGVDGADEMKIEGAALVSEATGQRFPFINDVPSLLIPVDTDSEDITSRVKSFYEENPFPSYEGLEEFAELVNKGSQNTFSAELLKAIGYNKMILECGCGTGQLSHFLQLNNNYVRVTNLPRIELLNAMATRRLRRELGLIA